MVGPFFPALLIGSREPQVSCTDFRHAWYVTGLERSDSLTCLLDTAVLYQITPG
jgi:hypothetical protein